MSAATRIETSEPELPQGDSSFDPLEPPIQEGPPVPDADTTQMTEPDAAAGTNAVMTSVAPIVFPPPLPPKTERVVLVREWEGVVDHFGGGSVTARIVDAHEPSEVELVEFSIEEVAEDDLRLVVPGAVFYWVIGRRTSLYGSVSNFSEIRFRRLPAWSQDEIDAARAAGSDLLTGLFGDVT